MRSISYRYLFPNYGGITRLFIDYIYNFGSVQRFYNLSFSDFSNLNDLIESVLKNYKNRSKIVEILERQNLLYANPNFREKLDLLRRDNTLAVVTGQQVGLLSGPLYTIYKIIATIKIANFLSEKFSDFNFVPVFYLESEDHDFLEANNAKVLNLDNEVVKISFDLENQQSENYGPIGEIRFNDKINDTLKKLEDTLQETEFKNTLMMFIRSVYKEGFSFADSFARFIGKIFEKYGLLFINPCDNEVKKMLTPIFEKEIDEYPKLSNLIIDVSAELEEKYHVQVKPRAINLFLLYKGGRYPIEPAEVEGMFRLKGARFKFSRGELKHILETNPQALSPNVVLRPICQDTLLPTIFYIAGPSEIAYFAQFKPAYAYFGIPMPVIFPRISVTLIEPKVKKILERHDIKIEEVFSNFSAVAKKIWESTLQGDIEEFFKTVREKTMSLLEEIKGFAVNIDPSLSDVVDSSANKIFYHINNIYEKTLKANQRRNEDIGKRIKKLKNNLLPEGEIQERILNIVYFLNKYDFKLIDKLFDETDVFDFNHQFVYL